MKRYEYETMYKREFVRINDEEISLSSVDQIGLLLLNRISH